MCAFLRYPFGDRSAASLAGVVSARCIMPPTYFHTFTLTHVPHYVYISVEYTPQLPILDIDGEEHVTRSSVLSALPKRDLTEYQSMPGMLCLMEDGCGEEQDVAAVANVGSARETQLDQTYVIRASERTPSSLISQEDYLKSTNGFRQSARPAPA